MIDFVSKTFVLSFKFLFCFCIGSIVATMAVVALPVAVVLGILAVMFLA